MKTRLSVVLVLLLVGLTTVPAVASPVPCRFGGYGADSSLYDIGAVYKAADLVVIGTVTGKSGKDGNLVFYPHKLIKGTVDRQILLHAHHIQNTEINGFVLPENQQVLLFLALGPAGTFDSVENYNSACAISYPVREGNVVLVESDEHNQGIKIPVRDVGKFLSTNPPKLIHKNR
jgi:hypothetical protein